MTPLPNIPMGNSRLANWMQRIQRALEAQRITAISGGEMKQTARGTMLIVKPGNQQQQSSTWVFRGEYKSTENYLKNDVVCIYSGSNIGTYICVKNRPYSAANAEPVPQTDPRHGTYWCIFAVHNTIGAWT